MLNYPFAWIGVRRTPSGYEVAQYDQSTDKTTTHVLDGDSLWVRADCDFISEKARFSFRQAGASFQPLGDEFTMIFQLKTFQGIRYSLFSYGSGGGWADFAHFKVEEPFPKALTRPIPIHHSIRLESMNKKEVLIVKENNLEGSSKLPEIANAASTFRVLDRSLGRVALQAVDGRYLTVSGLGPEGRISMEKSRKDDSQTFQWIELARGDLLLLSLQSHRYLRISPDGSVRADEPGPQFDRENGASLDWQLIN